MQIGQLSELFLSEPFGHPLTAHIRAEQFDLLLFTRTWLHAFISKGIRLD